MSRLRMYLIIKVLKEDLVRRDVSRARKEL